MNEEKKARLIAPLFPSDGGRISLCGEQIERWLADRDPGSSGLFCTREEIYYMKDCVLRWEDSEPAAHYTVRIGTDKTLADARCLETQASELVLTLPLTETHYYWQVSDGDVKSEIFSFFVEPTYRTLRVDGISNMRDLGGLYTEDGRRVKQGVAFRSARLDLVSELGLKQVREQLGIRYELDLRIAGEGGAGSGVSPLGKEVGYQQVSGCYYTGQPSGIDLDCGKEALVIEMRALADPKHYPIVFHCMFGRDRTGTLALVLYALLGVSFEEICKEYEVSFFSAYGGAQQQPLTRADGFVGQLRDARDYMMACGGGETLKESTERFLLSLGVTEQEIESIRAILLE